MSGTKGPQGGLTRRSFLKTTGLAAGVAASGAALGTSGLTALAADATDAGTDTGEQIYSGACRGNCMGGCPIEITVRDGKVVKCEAWDVSDLKEYRRICQRGRSHVQSIYNEKRLLYPLRRVGERGAGEWERISWEEAIDEVCSKWKSLQEEYGKGSLAFSFASGNYGIAFGQYLGFGYPYRLENALDATDVVHLYDGASGQFGNRLGTGMNTCAHMLSEAKTIMVWGSNPTECDVHVWHFIADALDKGAKLITIDPNYTIAASKASMRVPLRPGTDGAFAQTICNMVIENDEVDWEEVKFHTTLPALIKEKGGLLHVSDLRPLAEGEEDVEIVVDADGTPKPINEAIDPKCEGVTKVENFKVKTVYDVVKETVSEWTLARGADVCGLDEETIQSFYDTLIEGSPACAMVGLGLDHYENAFTAYGNIALMLSLTGNMSKRGGGLDTYFTPTLTFWGNFLYSMPDFHATTSPSIPLTQLPEIMKTGKLGSEVNGWDGVQDVTIKSIFIAYHNLLSNACDYNAQLEALKAMDFIVVSDMVETDTTKFADIILPCSHWFEQKDVFMLYSPFFTLQEQAIAPLGESKTNYEIFKLLAEGMGVGKQFSDSEDDVIKNFIDSDTMKASGLTWDRVNKEKVIPVKFDGSCIAAPDGRVNYYYAPGGRYTATPGYGGYWDMGQTIDWEIEGTPHWYPPNEAWTQSVDKYPAHENSEKYPLIYSTYRNKFKTHTQFGWNSWLLEIFPEPTVMANSAELEARGIKHDDYARVFNDRGEVVLKVVEHDGIHDGMIVVPKGWHAEFFKKGHYSTLTSRHQGDACTNNFFFDASCQMEKYEGSVN